MPRNVLALCNDMMFESRMRSVAQAGGTALAIARTPARLAELLAAGDAATVIVDLNTEGADAVEAVRVAKAAGRPVHVVAFLSHVQVDLARAAQAAGADEVLPRSQFVQRLPELLSDSAG